MENIYVKNKQNDVGLWTILRGLKEIHCNYLSTIWNLGPVLPIKNSTNELHAQNVFCVYSYRKRFPGTNQATEDSVYMDGEMS